MACIALLAPAISMATTQLTRTTRSQVSTPWQQKNSERQLLRMNGVVVTGKNGNRELHMQWLAAEDYRASKLAFNTPLMSPE
jgi:hypothetical protein